MMIVRVDRSRGADYALHTSAHTGAHTQGAYPLESELQMTDQTVVKKVNKTQVSNVQLANKLDALPDALASALMTALAPMLQQAQVPVVKVAPVTASSAPKIVADYNLDSDNGNMVIKFNVKDTSNYHPIVTKTTGAIKSIITKCLNVRWNENEARFATAPIHLSLVDGRLVVVDHYRKAHVSVNLTVTHHVDAMTGRTYIGGAKVQ